MKNYDFGNTAGTNQQITVAKLVAAAAMAEVARFNVAKNDKITISFGVTVAALTGLNVWVRGDTNASWCQLPPSELYGYARSDSVNDYTTTPAGQSGMVMVATPYFSEVRIDATSAGAAVLSITAGLE